jgi:hypothetical protein
MNIRHINKQIPERFAYCRWDVSSQCHDTKYKRLGTDCGLQVMFRNLQEYLKFLTTNLLTKTVCNYIMSGLRIRCYDTIRLLLFIRRYMQLMYRYFEQFCVITALWLRFWSGLRNCCLCKQQSHNLNFGLCIIFGKGRY